MKRTLLFCLPALALLSSACEKHSASALEESHGGPHSDSTQHAHSAPAHPNPALPFAPTTVPKNPAGAAPIKQQDARESTGQPHPDTAPHAQPAPK